MSREDGLAPTSVDFLAEFTIPTYPREDRMKQWMLEAIQVLAKEVLTLRRKLNEQNNTQALPQTLDPLSDRPAVVSEVAPQAVADDGAARVPGDPANKAERELVLVNSTESAKRFKWPRKKC